MKYETSLASVSTEFTRDPLWQMKVYRLAVFVGDLAWQDVSKLVQDRRMIGLADQLYRAVGSIGANIAEGYLKDEPALYEVFPSDLLDDAPMPPA